MNAAERMTAETAAIDAAVMFEKMTVEMFVTDAVVLAIHLLTLDRDSYIDVKD
ncbi:hypothetical protein TanjilG_03462 [Lupinus angustifolius]|uniref:Uncharacterized protein n=1 Tax=Lupinus angustifolius TaxID=3871 RepID=A0A394DE18_LUPAN|nr:hypothetical protein TanjilG_03462 [Lupinus angustifolius]